MADQVRWTPALVRLELAHLLCCSPDGRPCNLRFPERATVPGRSTNTDWAAFQIAAHARADVELALAEVFDIPPRRDWAALTVAEVRELPRLQQALYVLILRGPYDGGRGPQIPEDDQRKGPRFGFQPWKQAARILRRDRRTIQGDIAEAIDLIAAWLSPWKETEEKLNAAWRGMVCTPKIHVWGVGGVPHSESRCRCGRVVRAEWLADQAAKLLELC